jgi:acetyltransferase-like isoleucine patch superfamily enzyme
LPEPPHTHDLLAYLPNVDVGDYTYGLPEIIGKGHVYIGAFCSIADNVQILPIGDHHPDWVTTYPFHQIDRFGANFIPAAYHRPARIHIGNDVWIGHGARILHGVTIGDGAVIGAFSVVASDVEPYAIVAGNPARLIRKRFAQHVIDTLLDIKWWSWPIDKILGHIDELVSPDIHRFIRATTTSNTHAAGEYTHASPDDDSAPGPVLSRGGVCDGGG